MQHTIVKPATRVALHMRDTEQLFSTLGRLGSGFSIGTLGRGKGLMPLKIIYRLAFT